MDVNGDYFKSYANLSSHDVMLKDKRRMKFYREFCSACSSKFVKDKVVLDVGCGSGILSMYAASNGAKIVYAVEASEVAILAQKHFDENNLTNIQVIRGAIESIELPEKVDVIISEWMGFYLVHEGMLSSVIYARDNFLKPGGIIFPNQATLFAAPVDLSSYFTDNFSLYDNIDGYTMKTLKSILWSERLKSPLCEIVEPTSVLALASRVVNWKLDELNADDLDDMSHVMRFDIKSQGILHGLTLWFTVSFQSEDFCSLLDTSPYLPGTHWKQTSVFLPKFTNVEKGDQLIVDINLRKSEENPRWYDISVDQKSLTGKSFEPVEILENGLMGKSDCYITDEPDEVVSDEDDVISALIGALSEKYETDPNEIAEVIAKNAAAGDTETVD